MSNGKKSKADKLLTAKAEAAFRKASHDVVSKPRPSGKEVIICRDNRDC